MSVQPDTQDKQAKVEDGGIVLGDLQVLGDEYLGSPFLASEQERILATNSYLPPLNAETDPQCVAIGTAVSKVFGMPMGGVTFVGHDRVVCQANGLRQTEPSDRRFAMCNWLMLPLNPEMLVMEDIVNDARFASHPFVQGPPHLGFYAAAPLVTSTGFRIGTVYVGGGGDGVVGLMRVLCCTYGT